MDFGVIIWSQIMFFFTVPIVRSVENNELLYGLKTGHIINNIYGLLKKIIAFADKSTILYSNS